jgi:hypothetical protein
VDEPAWDRPASTARAGGGRVMLPWPRFRRVWGLFDRQGEGILLAIESCYVLIADTGEYQ